MSDDDDNIFQHLLDFQSTEEFQAYEKVLKEARTIARRPATREGSRVYRQRHPEAIRLRARAAKYKDTLYAQ